MVWFEEKDGNYIVVWKIVVDDLVEVVLFVEGKMELGIIWKIEFVGKLYSYIILEGDIDVLVVF